MLIQPKQADASGYIVTALSGSSDSATLLPRAENGVTPAAVVTQKQRAFEPADVTIRVHRMITITNEDDTIHNVYCGSPNFKYQSGPQEVGSTSNLTFRTPGIFEIRCAIHPAMKLVVTVTE